MEDQLSFRRSLAVVVRRPGRDAVEDHPDRGAEEYDRVEAVVELPLVPHTALNEEGVTVVAAKELRHSILHPQPLPAVDLVRGCGPLGPARIIRVHHAIAPSAELSEHGRLACGRHPGYEDPRHSGHGIGMERRGRDSNPRGTEGP